MGVFDYSLIGIYFIVLLMITFWGKQHTEDEAGFLLAGRKLTLPAFVATLVSTWYGGILGVGEFGFSYGVSQWVVFGFPYYVFAIIFALFFVKHVRQSKALSLPEAIELTYGRRARQLSAFFVFLLTSPAPYIVMLALLFQMILGIEAHYSWYAIGVTVFSLLYVWKGGFSAVVRTDILQMILMYVGFAVLVWFGFSKFDFSFSWIKELPAPHLHPTGNQSLFYVMVWFFIALWTFVDPGFHQRVAAAKSEKTARYGILVSVFFWLFFDLLTLTSSLLGVVLLPNLNEAVLVYPELAKQILPPGFVGVFYLGLLATIMSTLDSFLFLSGQSLGRDVIQAQNKGISHTRIGMMVSALLGILLSLLFPSVIDLWFGIGTIIIPALLFTVLGSFVPFFRISKSWNLGLMLSAFLTSGGWLLAKALYPNSMLQIEAFYPGMLIACILWIVGKKNDQ
jgi:SSS family solute:Na+ symporter